MLLAFVGTAQHVIAVCVTLTIHRTKVMAIMAKNKCISAGAKTVQSKGCQSPVDCGYNLAFTSVKWVEMVIKILNSDSQNLCFKIINKKQTLFHKKWQVGSTLLFLHTITA